VTWWLSFALAGRWLVGVEHGAVDLDRDADGHVDGTEAAVICYRSSRVCVVDGEVGAAELGARPGVRYVEADRPAQRVQGGILAPCPPVVAADEVGHELWRTGVPAGDLGGAWSVGRGAGALVAVQDAGFRTSHVDLDGQVARGWDYGEDDGRPEVSPAGVPEHGTFVAGVVAARDDGSGRVGVVPEAQLFVQKIADRTGALYFSYAVAAMDDLVQTAPEVKVVDYSIASLDPPQAFEDAVAALGSADMLLVTAAANCPVPNCGAADNDVNPVFPANYALSMDHVLAVASQQADGALDPYSHYGASSVALGAPGADVCSLGVGSDTDYVRASGTSYAAPVVAGVAALVREAFPRLTAADTEALLCASSAVEPGLQDRVRCGAVDADRAVHAAWPGAVTGDGVDAPVDVVVGQAATMALSVDNLAGVDTVQVSLVAEGVTSTPVEVLLAADGTTAVALTLTPTQAGRVGGQVVVKGCCASASTPWSADVAGASTPSLDETGAYDTAAPIAGPVAQSTAGGESGCGCASLAPRARISGLLARRRGRTAP